jgi:hypothetical protein
MTIYHHMGYSDKARESLLVIYGSVMGQNPGTQAVPQVIVGEWMILHPVIWQFHR